MAPPVINPQLNRKRLIWPWVVGGIVGTCLLGIGGLLGLGFLWQATERTIPMTADVRQALLTKEDLEPWAGYHSSVKAKETASLTVDFAKLKTAEYELDDNDVYISSSVEYGGKGDLAVDSSDFSVNKLIAQQAAGSTEGVVYRGSPASSHGGSAAGSAISSIRAARGWAFIWWPSSKANS